jgi:hydroxyacylglutathione hydrolase
MDIESKNSPPSAAVVEVYPGVFQILGRKRSAHAYVIKGARRNVLIDSCLPDGQAHVQGCLASLGLALEDIDMVLLTHEHIDHAGGVPMVAGHALVGAHRLAANKLTLNDEFVLMNQAFDAQAQPLAIDIYLHEGMSINLGNYELQVIHTPGHCSGAICFHEPRHQFLISGDVIMAEGIVGGVLQSGNISDYIHSLRRLSGLRVDCLLPGHGRISHDAQKSIALGIERLERQLEESKTLFQVVRDSQLGFDQIMRSLRNLQR